MFGGSAHNCATPIPELMDVKPLLRRLDARVMSGAPLTLSRV